MSDKVTVRIAVAVDPRGRWVAHGWYAGGDSAGPRNHDELLETYDYECIGPSERLFWLTAELPVPSIDEVSAAVEEKPQ